MGDTLHLRLLAAAAASLLLLSGCATTDAVAEEQPVVAPAPASKNPTPKPSATGPKLNAQERNFKKSVIHFHPELEDGDIEGMLVVGRAFCTLYDNGGTLEDANTIVQIPEGARYTSSQLATIHGSAVGAFCPNHTEKVTGG